MTVQPVPKRKPGYPGRQERSVSAWNPWRFTGRALFSMCLCAVLLGTPGSLGAQGDGKSLPSSLSEEPAPCRGESIPEPPCRGKVAVEPPCRGVAPPPCRGDVGPPLPPPVYYRVVTLDEYARSARTYLGMKIRISGILGHAGSDRLVGQGYYIYERHAMGPDGRFAGCPLVNPVLSVSVGNRVEVEGTVVRMRGGDARLGTTGFYYALEVDRLFPAGDRID